MKKKNQNIKLSAFRFLLSTNQSGFSMLEVMVAVFVIVIGMLSAIALLVSGLRTSMDSRDQMIAGLLSQEGVELVRNLRDSNWIKTPPVSTFTGISSGNCAVSVQTPLACPGASFQLYFDSANLIYTHNSSGTAATKFSRRVDIVTFVVTPDEKTVTSIVVWGGAFPASVADCNTKNKCAYASVVLNKWGGS